MDKHILSDVIEVEKEIQKKLETEKRKASEWLEKVKDEAEKDFQKKRLKIEEELNDALKEIRLQAEKKSLDILEKTDALIKGLEGLDEELLKKIILGYIIRILPR